MSDETAAQAEAPAAPPAEAAPPPAPVIDTYISPEGYTWEVTVGGNSFSVKGGPTSMNNAYDDAAGPFQNAEQAWRMYHISVEPLPAVAQEFIDWTGKVVDRLVTLVNDSADALTRIETVALQLERCAEALSFVGLFMPATAAAATELQKMTDEIDKAAGYAIDAQVAALEEMMPIRDRAAATKRAAEIPIGSRPPLFALEGALESAGDPGVVAMKAAGVAPPPPPEPAPEAAPAEAAAPASA